MTSPRLEAMAERAKTSTEAEAREIRTRLGNLEDRLQAAIGGRFAMVHIFASRYGWKASWSVTELGRAPDAYFPTPSAALDHVERIISAYEDRDGNLARTLGIDVPILGTELVA